jgi:hypothetical protein
MSSGVKGPGDKSCGHTDGVGVGLGSEQKYLVLVDVTPITSKDNSLTMTCQLLDRELVSRSLGNVEDIIQDHGGRRLVVDAR